MQEYARVIDDRIEERRRMADPPPAHKAYLWRPIVYEGAGGIEQVVIESDTVRIVRSEHSLDHIKSDLKTRIDDMAEIVRLRYITPGAGMAMTYAEKKDQAVAVLGMGEQAANALASHGAAEFPTLSASVPIEAASLYAAAQLVMTRYEQFAALSRVIELIRLTGKKAISDASDAAAARAAYEAITWNMP